jgi:alkane 1-monooxygenase
MPRHGFLLPLMLAPLVPLGWWLAGGWVFILPVFVWVALPLMDWALGQDPRNPDPAELSALESDRFYRFALYINIPIVIGLVVWVASVAHLASPLEFVGLALATGLVTGGVGIVVAHELGHRHGKVDRFLAHVLLAWVAYMHFFIEHNKGHHARVATPEDPATARLGESFWRYFPRSVVGQYRSAWRIDARATAWSVVWPTLLAVGLAVLFGWAALVFFLLQAFYAVLQLELVNYVEHYGLQRRELEPGRYEKVTVQHSWNSSHRLSNLLLFNLQRHSHHHAHQGKRYQVLEHFDEAPQLPAGYLAMLPLAMLPPLWRRVMDPRVPGGTCEIANG